jgi:hypothetical protein
MYKYYTDSYHGFLAVKRHELIKLGIADQISSYSFCKGETVYLEEDHDLNVFLRAKKEKEGKESEKIIVIKKYHEGRSPIRRYKRFEYPV